MIDIKKLTENPDEYKQCLKNRGWEVDSVDKLISLDKERETDNNHYKYTILIKNN